MFSLTVNDHVSLGSEHVAQNYMVHARAAERIVRLVSISRIAIAALLAIAMGAAIANLLVPGRTLQITTVVATALALFAFAVYAVLGLEARVFAHRSFAHRLWLLAERYRSLLSEVNEGIVDGPALVGRRDQLINDLHSIYEFGFGVDQSGHETSRLPAIADEHAA